jgi:ubiquitin C-terminal hydrolase
VLKNHEAKETSKSLLSDQTLQGSLETITDILIELKDNKELQP